LNFESGMMQKEKIKNFTDLYTWQEGHKLVLMVYKITREFPKEERFDLVSQMRRCAVSVTSNIAEGFSRTSRKEKVQFFSISHGSLTELQNQFMISQDVHYITVEIFREILEQLMVVHRLLNGLLRTTKLLSVPLPDSRFKIQDSKQ